MREQLIAYLLNGLSTEERLQVEESLRQDPGWQQELERLKTCLGNCEHDSDDGANPPEDLTTRTCCLIQDAERQGANRVDGEHGPLTLAPANAPCGSGQRWSLIDLTVAGGILATLAMVLLPALNQSREASRRLACKNNLRTIGQALIRYAEQNRQGLPHVAPQENAGIFTVKLTTSGIITPHQLSEQLVCPSSPLAEEVFSGKAEICVPTAQQLASAKPRRRLVILRGMAGSYAYPLGYVDQGIYHHIRFTGRSDSPMLADAPAPQTNGFYSSYHGGCGQNCGEHVLSQDWSVKFCRPCLSGNRRDNIYLNSDQQQAAGKGSRDTVLGRSEARPDGFTLIRWP
jgi:type II secretory pathway pseudopilin PulG